MISLLNLSAGREIGSNSYVLQFGSSKVLLDAGTHPKRDGLATLPKFSKLNYDELDAIFLSHAHLDHSGALPVAMREHPSARVFMSLGTKEVVDALLHNSVNVMSAKREELDIYEYPFYTHRELEKAYERWETSPVGKPFHFSKREDVTCEFFDAGHTVGAISQVFDYQGRRVLYTGDIHLEDQTLTRAAELPRGGLDTVIVETTRGASPRPPEYTRASEIDKLADSINAILENRGSVLMPVFAMGKTQELLFILHELEQDGRIPKVPVHIGGLSTKMTQIYDRLSGQTRRNYPGFQLLKELDLIICSNRKRAQKIEYQPGCIYALSSGMMTQNTFSNKFSRYFIENERCGVLFVGYCDPDSPAGKLLVASPGDKLQLNTNASEQELKCRVEKYDFSGHATRESILEYLVEVNPKNIALVHGDDDAMAWFEAQLGQRLPETRLISPEPGKVVEL